MNKLISGAILAVGIVLAVYGVSVSKSFSVGLVVGSGQPIPSPSGEDLAAVPSNNYHRISDLALSDDIGAQTRNAIETRENLLTQIELVPLDPQGNLVAFSPEVVGLPKRASFNPQTSTLVWRPWYCDAGTYELLFHDIGTEYTRKVMIHVEDVPLKSWYQEWIQSQPVQSAMIEY
jgi:hypothetical protein